MYWSDTFFILTTLLRIISGVRSSLFASMMSSNCAHGAIPSTSELIHLQRSNLFFISIVIAPFLLSDLWSLFRYIYRDSHSTRPYSYNRTFGTSPVYTPPKMTAEIQSVTQRRSYSGMIFELWTPPLCLGYGQDKSMKLIIDLWSFRLRVLGWRVKLRRNISSSVHA